MMNSLELGALGTAGIGGLTMVWSNIKGFFSRLESVFIVKADLPGFSGDDFMDYCWANFKSSPLGIRRFSASDSFVRPKNRIARVVYEVTGKHVTFWNGWKPIFVALVQDKDEGSMVSISFIRGTFNLENMLIESMNAHDKRKHDKSEKSTRYYVKRCFGLRKTSGGNIQPSESKGYKEPSSVGSNMGAGSRPLLYSKDDLGVPTSKKPMENLAYDNSVQQFFEEVSRWKESKEWFESKGLSWRLGAGLFGPPGTGKSSLARAIGQSLDMPIHSYDLTTMDNEEFVNFWQQSLSESPCMVLLEDIDRIFDEKKQIKTTKDKAPLTLDCLLNCISGVQPADGILVLVTANDVTKLDPALGVPDSTGKSTRPGRLDRAIYVGLLTKEGREKIAKRILSDNLELIESTVLEGEGETGAQFESRCSKLALEQRWGKFKIYGEENVKLANVPYSENSPVLMENRPRHDDEENTDSIMKDWNFD